MTDDEAPFTLERAWAHLGDLITMMMALFGAPASIAARMLLVCASRQDILRWLAPLEALARRLLLLEAAQLPPRNEALRIAPGRIASLMRDAPAPQLSENSADWRVIFNVWPQTQRQRPQSSFTPNAAGVAYAAIALAKRLEALARLTQDRSACLLRMARKLAARRATASAVFAPYRPNAGPVRTLLLQTQAHIEAVLADTS